MQTMIRLDTSRMTRGFDALIAKSNLAIARALNRSIASAKTAMVRVVAQDMGLKSGDVRDRILIVEARPDQHVAQLKASAKRIPLIDFNARGPEPSRGKGRGVTARMPGGKGRCPHAFIATMKTGHRGVFQRRAKSRLHIDELFGASIAYVFTKLRGVGEARAQEQLVKNLQSEIRFALRAA